MTTLMRASLPRELAKSVNVLEGGWLARIDRSIAIADMGACVDTLVVTPDSPQPRDSHIDVPNGTLIPIGAP